MVTTQEATVEHSLLRLLKYVEQLSQYKVHYVGWLLRKNGKWTHVPRNASSVMEVVSKAEKVSKSMTKRELHGILMGSSLRSFKPPHGTKGILVTWIRGGKEYAVQQHNSDHHVKMKKVSNYLREEVCALYFYYYEMANEETEVMDKKENDVKMVTPKSSTISDATIEEQEQEARLKRQGPDSRTVVLAPEKKKQKIHYIENNQIEDYLREFHYYMNRRRKINLEFPDAWKKDSQLFYQSMRTLRIQYYNEKKKNLPMLFNIDYKHDCGALACLRTARIYKVDSDTSNIDEENIDPKLWKEVDQADEAEIKQFADEKAFKKIHRMQISEGMIEIDGVWIRKKKRYPGGELKMKSRMCARGCFDSQKHQLTTRSTTATKLSQRLAVSTAARKNLKLESLDIGGAFLKGYSFEAIRKALQKRGIQAPERKVVVYPPANVWRHLAKFDPQFDIGEDNISNYGLLCLKPIYGLNDAPLAWQMVLHEYVLAEGATASKMDENFFMWRRDGVPDSIYGVLTCHVDDLAIAGEAKWLDGLYERMVKKFKKVTRQTMPFEHCGAEYSETKQGLCISQKAFTERLQSTVVPNRPDDDKLKPEEVTMFRSQLGALLWLTSTRLDLIAEVSFLQSKVTTAQIKDLKQTNNVIQKAKDYKELGIHYRRFKTKNQRLVCIHDASSASKGRNYAQEGVLVAVADDYFVDNIAAETSDEDQVKLHGGAMHIIHAHGCKAKRVSYSTSHAETLSMVGGLETATLCMLRLAEMMHPKKEPSLKDLIEIQESGHPNLPMDFYGDCRDLFELVTGERTLPQDKTQRLYVLAVKEARLSGRLRYVNLVPTQSMTADCLTKSMVSECMMLLLTTGIVTFKNEKDHAVLSRTLPVFEEIEEDDLLLRDEEVKHKVQTGEKLETTTCRKTSTTPDLRLKTLLTFLTFVTADGEAMEEKPVNSSYMSVYVAVFFTVLMALMVEKYSNKIVAKIYDLAATWWTRRMVKLEVKVEPPLMARPAGLSGLKRKVSDASVEPMEVDQSHMDVDDSGGATKDELLRRLVEKEQHIKDLRQDFKTSDEEYTKMLLKEIDELKERITELGDDNQENLDKYGWAMDNHARAVDRIRILESQLKQKDDNTRLTATRFGNLQTKYNEKEAELTKLQERYERLAMNGLPMSPLTQNAMKDLRQEVQRKNTEILKLQSDIGSMQEDIQALQGELEEKKQQLENLQGNWQETDRCLQERNRQLEEKNKRYEDAIHHGRELQERLNVARAPEEIAYSSHGTCYHMPGCNHMHGGGKSLRKCKTCLP